MTNHYGPAPYFPANVIPPAPPGYYPNTQSHQYIGATDNSQSVPGQVYVVSNCVSHQQTEFPVSALSNAHQWAQAAGSQQISQFPQQDGRYDQSLVDVTLQSMPMASIPVQNSIPPLMSIDLTSHFPHSLLNGPYAQNDSTLAISPSLQQLRIAQEMARRQQLQQLQQLAAAQRAMQIQQHPQVVLPSHSQPVLPVADHLPNFLDRALLSAPVTNTGTPLDPTYPPPSLTTLVLPPNTESIIDNGLRPLSLPESTRLPSVQPSITSALIDSSLQLASPADGPAKLPFTPEQMQQIHQLLASFVPPASSSLIHSPMTPSYRSKKRAKKNADCIRVLRKGPQKRGLTGVIVTKVFTGAMTDEAREWFERRGRLPFKVIGMIFD